MFDELDQLLTSTVFDTTPKDEALELHDGERREVSILFADMKGFTALSERLDPERVRMILDKLLQLFTLCIRQYGGYIDKYEGDLVMALFGAKIASEGDTERAIHAALQMLGKLKQFNALLARNPVVQGVELGVRIGINTGLVTTGRIGAKREGDFTVYGDAVNLASRMESNAPVGRIMIPEETVSIVKDAFEFEDHGKIEVKGKSEPVSVFLVKGLKPKPIQRWHVKRSVYVGRDKELAVLFEKYDVVLHRLKNLSDFENLKGLDNQKPIVVGIKGQAGIGKSRLIYEFLKSKEETPGTPKRTAGVSGEEETPGVSKQTTGISAVSSTYVLQGTTPRIAQNPYCVFTSMIKGYLGISQIDPFQVVKEKLEAGFHVLEASLNDEHEVRNLRDILPFVGFLLGVRYYDVRLQLKGKELQSHLQTAIRYFLEATAAKANRAGVPLLVILEDVQWLDEASRSTLDFLMQTLNLEEKRKQKYFKHFLFIFVYRPEYEVPKVMKIKSEFSEIELFPLDENNAEQLIQSMIGDIALPANVKQQVMEKSEGNPFYLEEWANLIKDLRDFENLADLPVPKTLTALVLSRIDRLEHDVKLLLQKAAVIGKEFFANILAEIEKKLHRPEDISVQLDHLETSDFVRRMLGSKYSAYLFKHIITQEVAYNTLLIANRKILHRIAAEVIEEQFAENIEEFYYDLAEHYSKAEIMEKKIEYLKKAGDKAKANYDNEKAVVFYDRLLVIYNEFIAHRIDTLLEKGKVLELIGKWQECGNVYGEALRFSEEIGDKHRMGEANRALGNIFHLQGDDEQAMAHYGKSLALSQTLGDQASISKAVGNIGVVYWRKGDYDAAMKCFEKDLKLCEGLGDKRGISEAFGYMGIIYWEKGDYNAAMACFEKDLALCEELGDKRGISEAVGNMGNVYALQSNYDAAMASYQKQLKFCEELGDKQGISIAVGNMGEVYKKKGDYDAAMASYQKALQIKNELGEKAGISKAVGNIGEVYYLKGDYDAAAMCYQKKLKLCEELGDKQGISSAVGDMGNVYLRKGDDDAVMACYQKQLTICEELGNKQGISVAVGNIGNVYVRKGDYDEAMACYEKKLKLCEELGNKQGISIAVGNMGEIYKEKGDYDAALTCYNRAIAIDRELGRKYGLAYKLVANAEVLFLKQRFDEARRLNAEGLQIAREIGRQEKIFQSKLLSAKIDFALGNREQALTLLSEMLAQTEDEAQRADVHYELYQFGVEHETHRKEALRLYQELYTKTPNFEWKKRIEILSIKTTANLE